MASTDSGAEVMGPMVRRNHSSGITLQTSGRLYWLLFAAESVAFAYFLYNGLPLYHRLLSGPTGDYPAARLVVPAFCAVVLMQTCYWTKRKGLPSFHCSGGAFWGHLLLFFSRLSYVFPGSLFTLVFLVRLHDTRMSVSGVTVLLAGLFSMFCYSLELERLGKGLSAPKDTR